MKRRMVHIVAIGGLIFLISTAIPVKAEAPGCQSSEAFCYQPAAEKLIETIQTITEPPIAVPLWLGAGQ